MHNEVLSLIESHVSVRRFQADADVPEEHEEAFIRAAQKASTSCNLQAYSFVSIRERNTKAEIARLSGDARAVDEAPLLLMVCMDQYKLEVVAEKAGVENYQSRFVESLVMGVADASTAAQNGALAAESFGYGICYIGALRYRADEIRQILELPPKVFPLFGIAIGVPAAKNNPKPRLPLEGVWFKERYDTRAAERAIEEYDNVMAQTGVYDGRRFAFGNCKLREGAEKSEQEHYGWIEHSARRISSTAPADVRPQLGEMLREAGFEFI